MRLTTPPAFIGCPFRPDGVERYRYRFRYRYRYRIDSQLGGSKRSKTVEAAAGEKPALQTEDIQGKMQYARPD